MSPDEQNIFIDEARRAAETITTEAEMDRWHSTYANSHQYLQLDDDGRDAIEGYYERALRRLWGVDA